MIMNKYFISRNLILNYSRAVLKISTSQKLSHRHCSVRRALLYIPGSDEVKLKSANSIRVDCLVLDCENVPKDKKDEARSNIKKYLDESPLPEGNTEWSVRINPVETPELCEDDLNAVLSAKYLPKSICLPKVNDIDQLQWFAEKVWSALMKRPEDDRGPIKLLMIIESAIAILTLPELCKKSFDLSSMAPIMPVGLIFGAENLLGDLGAHKTQSSIELLYVRQKLVLVAKAFGLQAIDMLFTNYQNKTSFFNSCKDGATLGFTGKQIIHPEQIVIAHNIFTPSRSQIHRAKSIIYNFKKNEEGKEQGTHILESTVRNMSIIRQAEIVLDAAKAAGKL